MNASISVINKQIDNCSIILTDSYKLVDQKKGILLIYYKYFLQPQS